MAKAHQPESPYKTCSKSGLRTPHGAEVFAVVTGIESKSVSKLLNSSVKKGGHMSRHRHISVNIENKQGNVTSPDGQNKVPVIDPNGVEVCDLSKNSK